MEEERKMKKNLLAVLILALVLSNLILTAILTFSIIPEVKKTDALVNKIANAIDLELKDTTVAVNESIPIDQIAVYNIPDSMTINLKRGADGKDHFAVLSVSLSMNTKNKDYEKYSGTLSEKESLIKNEINNVVSSYTMEEIKENTEAIQEELLKNLQTMFNSDFIIQVVFSGIAYQ